MVKMDMHTVPEFICKKSSVQRMLMSTYGGRGVGYTPYNDKQQSHYSHSEEKFSNTTPQQQPKEWHHKKLFVQRALQGTEGGAKHHADE